MKPTEINIKPFACFLSALIFLATPPWAQHIDGGSLESGRSLFQKNCANCHGANAKGGRGPDLTTGHWRYGGSQPDLLKNIREGITGTQMPAFAMSIAEAKAVVDFLYSIQEELREEPLTGDPQQGRLLFFGSGQCSRCHMVGGRGGRLGPDLTQIKEEKKTGDLRLAITQPNRSIRPNFETVDVEFSDGKTLRGVAKNQDTYSVQLMDTQEKIHLLLRKDLKRLTRAQESLMPVPSLRPSDVEDVIAFLSRPLTGNDDVASTTIWKPSADLNVSFQRLRNASYEPQNWLTYWGNYEGRHFSMLDAITPGNVSALRSQWTFQYGGGGIEATPLVVDGLMFVTGPLNNATALDARTGRVVWQYRRRLPEGVRKGCMVMTNRGFGILGDRLYMATLDTHLVALDTKTGNMIWDVPVDDYEKGLSITHAPLVIEGKVIVGVTLGECPGTGFVDAYDATTGKKLWRFWSIPQKGDPARATWAGNSADFGGAPTWMTGTYDVETDTLFWTTGNPLPTYDGYVREGDNLYSCSVLALNPVNGKLKWYFQFTPHDTHDWDSNETPVLIDARFQGEFRKLLIQANRNGFCYVLDRLTGKFLLGTSYGNQTWAVGMDATGRPIVNPNTDPSPRGNYVCSDAFGNTNWASPSYDAQTGLLYVAVREACATYRSDTRDPRLGEPYYSGDLTIDPKDGTPGAIRAIDPLTGEIHWNYELQTGSPGAGVLGTAGGVVFAASDDGYLIALESRSGRELWHYQTGAKIQNSPISYSVDGQQRIAISTSFSLMTFGLPEN